MNSIQRPAARMEILDLRHFSAAQLGPLLRDEAGRWQRRLHWDYSAATEMLLEYIDGRVLPGLVALEAGSRRLLGYCFCVYEADKAVVGDVYAFGEGESQQNPVCEALLTHLLEMLQATPGVRRIESQLLMFPAGALAEPFEQAGFRRYRRLFLAAELNRLPAMVPPQLPAGMRAERWRPQFYDRAAELIRDAYADHTDAEINDQYRSVAGAERFLHNIVRFPGCGVFEPEDSWVLREAGSGPLAGAVLCSRVLPEAAHITQLCVARQQRGHHLGQWLLGQCMEGLRRRGLELLTLTVTEANAPACELYRQHGFQTLHRFEARVWEAGSGRRG